MTDIAELATAMDEAQRRSIESAFYRERDGAWCPEGWCVCAERRINRNLVRKGLIRGYLRPANLLTELGLAVRAYLQHQENQPSSGKGVERG